MLAHFPVGAQPLSALAGPAAQLDDTVIAGAFDDDLFSQFVQSLAAISDEGAATSPLVDAPAVADDTVVAASPDDVVWVDALGCDAVLETWSASPFDDAADAPPPPPPQPGPLSALGGAGWFADVPASRRKKQKPTWPNLPPPSLATPKIWRLTTITGDTARLRAHRAVKALRARLKRETNLEDHVISGILAALIADQDKDD